MPAVRDEEYAAVAERERPLIQATAYLLTGDPAETERVVQLVLAQLNGRWHGMPHHRVEAIRAVVRAARAPVHLPWEDRKRVELIDGAPAGPAAARIVADLQMLTYDQRVVIILDRYAGLSSGQVAQILHRPVDEMLLLSGQARAVLAPGRPDRASDEALAQELREAIPYDLEGSHDSTDDVSHGRQLLHRRWLLRGSAALVAAVLIVVVGVVLIPTRPPVPQAAPSQPSPTALTVNCEPSSATCQAQILLRWRSRMTEVAASHLDPTGMYFSGFGYSYDGRYDTPTRWTANGGALAFEMFRLDEGATEVWLQVASSREFAVRCGATTRQKCLFIRFMDGNSYLMTDSTLAEGGIEVQFSPNGDEVITVIARNTKRGQTLKIGSGELIKLVQDKRLRLPERCCYRR
jgi:hypothetical protein